LLKRDFFTSHRRDGYEWLESQKFAKMIKTKEAQINVQQLNEERKYNKFRPVNIALLVIGVASGAYIGVVMVKKSRLDAGDRKGHEDCVTALKRAFCAVALGVALDMSNAFVTIGIHTPLWTLGGAFVAYLGVKLTYKLFPSTGTADGGVKDEVEAETTALSEDVVSEAKAS